MLDFSERKLRCMNMEDPANEGVLFRPKSELFAEKSFIRLPKVEIKMRR